MATPQYDVTTRNNILQAIEDRQGASPVMKIFNTSGSPPANCAAADAGVELGSLSLPSDAFGAPSNGVSNKSGTWSGTGSAAGDTDFYRIYLTDGTTCVEQGLVTDQAGAGVVKMDSVTVSIGKPLVVNTGIRNMDSQA